MRRLTPAEVEAYDVVPRAVAARVRIQHWRLLAPGTSGMTFGRLILLRTDDDRDGTRQIIAHELIHVGQYAEHGLFGFLARYVRAYVHQLCRLHSHRRAYLAIPFEQEAYAEADRWAARHLV